MVTSYYQVRTARGFVGALSVASPLTDTLPQGFGYCYDDEVEASDVASRFGGRVVEVVR